MSAPSNGKVLACDVDGTLITGGKVHTATVEALKRWHTEGKEIILWSARGTEYAKQAAQKAGITDLCTVIIGKPAYLIDDKGANWIRFCRRIIPQKTTPNQLG